MKEIKKCPHCWKIFESTHYQIYCSKKCGYMFRRYGVFEPEKKFIEYIESKRK